MAMTLDGSNGVTFNDASLQGAAASPYVLKNRIINGGFQVWQRSTSSSSTSGYYTADRWYVTGTANVTVSKSANPTSPNGNYFLTWTTSASSSFLNILQCIESVNITDLRNQTVTLSAWVQTTAGSYTGNLSWAMYSNTTDAFTVSVGQITPTSSTSVTPTGTWQQIKATFVIPATCVSLTCYLLNSSVQPSGVTVNYADVQLEVGSTVTPLEKRLYNQELANCQRYYYKNFPNAANGPFGVGQAYSTTQLILVMPFKSSMRITPTALEQSGTAANYGAVSANGTGLSCNAVPTFYSASPENAAVVLTFASGLVAGNASFPYAFQSGAYFAWSAEL